MADIAFEKDLSVAETGIGGLKVVDLAVHGDSRGWFKENWQRAKMTALGIPDLRVVQNNISYNDSRGVTRGIHAEPWDKFISVARGSVFGAWVDLREGSATYGKVFTCTLDPSRAIYVPRGVGNSFQALEDGTAYTYLVDAHWSLELKRTYTFVNLADPELNIQWPIPLDRATVSEADLNHPMLRDVVPMAPKRTLVTGCNGQLGRAVRALAEERGVAKDFDFCDIDTFDMSDPAAYSKYDWSLYGTVINCGAYTAVASLLLQIMSMNIPSLFGDHLLGGLQSLEHILCILAFLNVPKWQLPKRRLLSGRFLRLTHPATQDCYHLPAL